MRCIGLVIAAMLLAACSDSAPVTNEELALRTCDAAREERLGLSEDEDVIQRQTIGRRDYGWLVRGLTGDVAAGARNFECRLDEVGSEPPTLTYIRLCEAGEEPWGCPE